MAKRTCCTSSNSSKSKKCSDLNLSVTTELFPSGRIGYFFKTQNNGPLLAVSADLVVIFSGVADPPTQAGWSFQGNSAKSSLGNVTAGSPPITSVITFRTNQKSDVIGFITSQTPDCEVGNGSAVSSYIPM